MTILLDLFTMLERVVESTEKECLINPEQDRVCTCPPHVEVRLVLEEAKQLLNEIRNS